MARSLYGLAAWTWPESTLLVGAVRLLAALAVGSALAVSFYWLVPELLVALLRFASESFPRFLLSQFATSVVAFLPPALLLGIAFPLAALYAQARARVAAPVGAVYAANTAGAILGALVTGFVFIPLAGTVKTLLGAAAFSLSVSALLLCASSLRRYVLITCEVVVAVGLVVLAYSGRLENPQLLSEGIVAGGATETYHSKLSLGEIIRTLDVTFFTEGRHASVAVVRREGFAALRVNSRCDVSTDEMPTQLLTGFLPGLLHPAPRNVLVIGWGAGGTVRALVRLPEIRESIASRSSRRSSKQRPS